MTGFKGQCVQISRSDTVTRAPRPWQWHCCEIWHQNSLLLTLYCKIPFPRIQTCEYLNNDTSCTLRTTITNNVMIMKRNLYLCTSAWLMFTISDCWPLIMEASNYLGRKSTYKWLGIEPQLQFSCYRLLSLRWPVKIPIFVYLYIININKEWFLKNHTNWLLWSLTSEVTPCLVWRPQDASWHWDIVRLPFRFISHSGSPTGLPSCQYFFIELISMYV